MIDHVLFCQLASPSQRLQSFFFFFGSSKRDKMNIETAVQEPLKEHNDSLLTGKLG